MLLLEILLAILVVVVATILIYLKWSMTYWKRKGLAGPEPTFPFGNTKDVILGKKTIYEVWRDVYFDLKSRNLRHGGGYLLHMPQYIPVDLEIVKEVFQTECTQDHGMYVNEENNHMSGHLVSFSGTRWKNSRTKLTNAFTPAKLKMIFEVMSECAKILTETLDGIEEREEPIQIKDVLARFSMDIIGSTFFGLECNALRGKKCDYIDYGAKIVKSNFRFLGQTIFPSWFLDLIGFHPIDPTGEAFFDKLVRTTIKHREETSTVRKDFLHMMIQLKNRGVISNDDKMTKDETAPDDMKMSLDEVAAQCMVFFLAGFETSSTTAHFATYELAVNQDIQEKARVEIETVLSRHGGKLSYEALGEMMYLGNVISEALRKYPPLTFMRRCTKDFKIPESDLILEKGTDIFVPVLGIHHDPQYYPNPENFDPDRFSEENKHKIPTYAWLPFGEGPRICIGKRFGIMQAKLSLVTLLRDYRVTLSKKKEAVLDFDPKSITLSFKDFWVDLEKIKH